MGVIGNSFINAAGVNQKESDVRQQNIAYSKSTSRGRMDIQEKRVAGTSSIVASVNSVLNEFLQQDVLSANSESKSLGLLSELFQERISPIIARDGDGKSLQVLFGELFTSIRSLEAQPAEQVLREKVLNSLDKFSFAIKEKSKALYDMRFELDQSIANDIKAANDEIESIKHMRENLMLSGSDVESANLKNDIAEAFDRLSKYIPIKVYTDQDNIPSAQLVTDQSNSDLFSLDISYYLGYQSMKSVQHIIDDKEFSPVTLEKVMHRGFTLPASDIVSGGTSASVISHIKGGIIATKIEMIHKELPRLIDQLDQLAYNSQNLVNSAHNKGTGYLPAPELTSTRLMSGGDVITASGKAIIGLVGLDGLPLKKMQSNGDTFIPPLIIDFDKLDFGQGIGQLRVQDIMNIINRYFGDELSGNNRAELGVSNNVLSDVKLYSKNQDMQVGSTFSLGIELSNYSLADIGFKIKDCIMKDSLGTSIPVNFNPDHHVAEKGGPHRIELAASFVPPSLDYPYEVAIDVEVSEGDKSITRTLTYKINDPSSYNLGLSGLNEFKFSIDSMSGPYGPGSRVAPPLLGKEGVIASLIDKNNAALADNDTTQNGRLTLKSGSDKWRFAIYQDTSSLSGVSGNGKTLQGLGLSGFFGLNDLLVRGDSDIALWHAVRNTALNIKVRDDIARNHAFFSGAKLETFVEHGNNEEATTSTPLYSVSTGDSHNVHEIAKAIDTRVEFVSQSDGDVLYASLLEYSQQVVVSVASKASRYAAKKIESDNREVNLRSALHEKSGISKETEMIKIMEEAQVMSFQLSATQKSIQVMDNIIRVISSVSV